MSQVEAQLRAIHQMAGELARPLRIMEVCGTHTVSACRSGLRSLLPANLSLLAGPGCPVCVTPSAYLDQAIALARQKDVILASFGDLLRVPGAGSTLERERARGAQVRVIYSAWDALQEAQRQPQRQVVLLGVGFETTAPSVAWTVKQAQRLGLDNFTLLGAHKTMPAAMAALLRNGALRLDGFLCPGHVSAIIGSRPYEFICRDYQLPCVVAGFEPLDMLAAIAMILRQLLRASASVEIQYTRGASPAGNPIALALLEEVFQPCASEWRGLGSIAGSGLELRPAWQAYDAWRRWPDLELPRQPPPTACICGDILRGLRTPLECPLFGQACTPTAPQGACMVSSEGACAAYYHNCRAG